MLLLVVALGAAAVAAQKPADIVFLVSAAFSIGAAALFPALVLGVFWKRANDVGATLGMASGLLLTVYYMVRNETWMRDAFGISVPVNLWFGMQPISAGVFGVLLGFAVIGLTSLFTHRGGSRFDEFVDRLRYPG